MRKFILGTLAAMMILPTAPVMAGQPGPGWSNDRHDNGRRGPPRRDDWRRGRDYDWNHPDPRYRNYDAARYYRQGNYKERRLGRNDRIYRGSNGRYYCRRNDGTTGLIVGGVLGGLLGNTIASGGSNTLGTLLGAGGGALLGREVDRGNVRCR
jgi:hypothetical protein